MLLPCRCIADSDSGRLGVCRAMLATGRSRLEATLLNCTSLLHGARPRPQCRHH